MSDNLEKAITRQRRSAESNRFGWIRDPPDYRDFLYSTHRLAVEASPNLEDVIDLTPGFGGQLAYQQGHLRACSPNAVAAAFQFDQLRQHVPSWVPARLFIYYNARALNGTTSVDCGATLRDCMKVLIMSGTPAEADWPYDETQFQATPPAQAYNDARFNEVTGYFKLDSTDVNQLKTCLSAGFPFAFGLTLFSSYYQTGPDGVIPMPSFGEERLGAHALLAVGYNDDKSLFMIRNSFGPEWGLSGYGYLPYQYLTNSQLAGDAWTIRAITAPPPPAAAG